LSQDRQETKEKLLDAAECLFARRGFEEVSIRELATEAGVNVAAVNYHFQTKENLFREVIARRFVHQRDITLGALNRYLVETGPKHDLAPVIHILAEQYLRSSLAARGGSDFMMLMARELHATHNHGSMTFFKEMVLPVFSTFSKAIRISRPGMSDEELAFFVASVVGQIHHFIVRWHKIQTLGPDSPEGRMMISMFPVLGRSLEEYITEVSNHITRFSTAAAESLYPEVSE
jgi:AcrR family transcriptional regulator